MSSHTRVSLEDTYHLVQMAREAALAQGRRAQADRLKPVAEEIRSLINEGQPGKTPSAAATGAAPAIPAVSHLAAQSGFQKLLELSTAHKNGATGAQPVADPNERNRLVLAMASADMPDLEIARQLGMAREEVRLVIDANQNSSFHRR